MAAMGCGTAGFWQQLILPPQPQFLTVCPPSATGADAAANCPQTSSRLQMTANAVFIFLP
jgi:hypothetical protein